MLKDVMIEKKEVVKEVFGEINFKKIEKSVLKLSAEGYIYHIAKAGYKLPNVSLLNSKNEEVFIYDEIKDKKTIISFYRGAWCPFCNLELAEYRKLLKDENINMIAISPELPVITEQNMISENLPFEILSDKDNKLAKKLNLCFHLPKYIKEVYKKLNIDLAMSQGNSSDNLPIPATYVVDEKGVILKDWIYLDYMDRAEPEEVINYIKSL